ncbi:hypothetical protein MRX96_015480 [Rhipicephalus microplus]
MEEMARQYYDSRLLVNSVSEAIAQSLREHYVCEGHDSNRFPPYRELRSADGRYRVTVLPLQPFFDVHNWTRRVAAAGPIRNFIIDATAKSYASQAGRHPKLPSLPARVVTRFPLKSDAGHLCPRIFGLARKGAREP